MSGTDVLIWVAGVAGLAVAVFGLVSLLTGAVRGRRPLEAVAALAITALVIWFLLAHGDLLLR